MAAPIRKVAPNGFGLAGATKAAKDAAAAVAAAEGKSIQESISAFGIVVSSTAPGSLARCSAARLELRRLSGLS